MSIEVTRSAFSDPAGAESSFSDRVTQLVARIDCRRADSSAQRDAIFRLRYDAYLREGAISPNSSGTFSDRYDETPNAYLFGLYIDDELASSIRIHVATKEHPACPSFEAFPDFLQPELDAGKVIVDATRFVADKKLSKRYRALPYATVRLNWLAAGYFDSDYSLAAVRPEHQAFYRRTFRLRLICEPRPYLGLTKPLCLMASDYRTVADYVHRRFPFFRSTFFERRKLFERSAAPASHESSMLPGKVAPFVDRDTPCLAG
jgi:hypothetical protein